MFNKIKNATEVVAWDAVRNAVERAIRQTHTDGEVATGDATRVATWGATWNATRAATEVATWGAINREPQYV